MMRDEALRAAIINLMEAKMALQVALWKAFPLGKQVEVLPRHPKLFTTGTVYGWDFNTGDIIVKKKNGSISTYNYLDLELLKSEVG